MVQKEVRRAAIASFVGTTIEWYDFFLYGTATALVFNKLFFPTFDPLVGTLAAFGTYSVGFLARPIGGVVCGHYGDKLGRKSMLVFTVLLMGIATFLIGLLPTYATIGVWAPILLVVLRVLQGFGVGGEWGGAVLMAVEHSPQEHRGFYGSWPQMGVPAGLMLSTAIFTFCSTLPEEKFLAWGWRVSFLFSLLLVAVGFFIRLHVMETPTFTQVKETRTEARLPILEVLRHHRRSILLAAGARFAENGAFYIFSVFVLTYATQHAGFLRSTVLHCVLLASAMELCTIPLFGALSDRLGRRPVYLAGALFTGVWAFPFFWLIHLRSTPMLALAIIPALAIGHAAMYGPQASFFSELFGARVRYTGASLGYQLSSVFAGGLSPLIATALLTWKSNGPWLIAIFLMSMAALTVLSVYLAAETRPVRAGAESRSSLET